MSKFEKTSMRSTPAFDHHPMTSRGTSPHRVTSGSPSHHHGHPRQTRSLSPLSGGSKQRSSKNSVIVCHASAHAVVRDVVSSIGILFLFFHFIALFFCILHTGLSRLGPTGSQGKARKCSPMYDLRS
jgi:hypothetical protein